jgi:hypothetical protein
MSGVDIDSVADEPLAAYRTGKTLDSGRPRNREDAVSSPPCGSPSRAPTPFPGSRYLCDRRRTPLQERVRNLGYGRLHHRVPVEHCIGAGCRIGAGHSVATRGLHTEHQAGRDQHKAESTPSWSSWRAHRPLLSYGCWDRPTA